MSWKNVHTLNEFVFQAWWPLDFVGYQILGQCPSYSACRRYITAELQTHIQDDELIQSDPVIALMFTQVGTDVYYPGGMKTRISSCRNHYTPPRHDVDIWITLEQLW